MGKSLRSQDMRRTALQKMLGLGEGEDPYCTTCRREGREETHLVVLTMSHRKQGQGSRDRRKTLGGQNLYRAVLGGSVRGEKHRLPWFTKRFVVECMNHNLIRDNQGFGNPRRPKRHT